MNSFKCSLAISNACHAWNEEAELNLTTIIFSTVTRTVSWKSIGLKFNRRKIEGEEIVTECSENENKRKGERERTKNRKRKR